MARSLSVEGSPPRELQVWSGSRARLLAAVLSVAFAAAFWPSSAAAQAPVLVDTGEDAALICDVVRTATFSPSTDHDFFTFSVSEDEIVTITTEDFGPETPSTYWRLLVDGTPASSCGLLTIFSQDCGPFSEAPTTLTLEVQELLENDTGDYAVHLQRLPFATACDQVPLTEDVIANASIEHFVDNDLFNLCVTDGASVRVTVVDPFDGPMTPHWRLLNGAGAPAEDCGDFRLAKEEDCGSLSAAGNPHRIQVQDFLNNTTGGYTVLVSALVGDLIECPVSPHVLIFEDGFESGDTAAWSSTTP